MGGSDERTDADGLPAMKVGPWAISEKHARLRRYVGICSAVRKGFLPPQGTGGAAYIDLYCGPGRVWLEDDASFHDGSPLVALREADKASPFSEFCLGDLSEHHVAACAKRLQALGGSVHSEHGPAEETVGRLTRKLNRKYGFHIAMLDPFSLDALPFSVIEALATEYKRIDLIIHFSKQDLQRNLGNFISGHHRSLDRFAPGWKGAVQNVNAPQATVRGEVVQHWLTLIRRLDFQVYENGFELVKGEHGQHLYWLVFASRHPRGHDFWDKIRNLTGQRGFSF
jgi:three-Cys-motif partner protein